MQKVVVTGGAGFIGSHIVEEGLSRGHRVQVVDNLHSGNMENLKPLMASDQLEFTHADILDMPALRAAFQGADTVFHLAALISVPGSMSKPIDYVEVNTTGTLQVLEACRLEGVKNVVFSSSAAIYGDNPTIPKTEDMFPEPQSPYAVTKLDGEYYFDLYRREHGLNATALRYFNVFGPRQDPNSQYAAAVPIFIHRALNNAPITIYGDGEQTRDFIYVKDIVQANYLAAERPVGGLFNVAWGQLITINDLAKQIVEITGSQSVIEYAAERPGDVKHSMADNQKIVSQLGFQATSNLATGLRDTIASAR